MPLLPSRRKPAPAASRTTPVAGPAALAPEVYRQAYVGLTLPPGARTAVIGVTSAIRGEGRTTVALGLARTLATDLETAVTLVEADFERPALAVHFELAPAPGLCEVLRGECLLGETVLPVADRLSVVTAGAVGPDAARLLRRLADGDPFHADAGLPGIVVLDLPPLLDQGYGSLAAGVADALVLVVRAGVTPDYVAREAIARLEGRPPQGVILNGFRTALPRWWPGSRV